uniref:Putative secreted protein n=1 Tax=Anopheles darlingi TaxID=43151 RepID=A0A2M4DAN6_ANODA
MVGMYWITFFAYALQLPSTRTFSQNIHPINQSISYVWFINSSTCSVPQCFISSSLMYKFSVVFDHQSARNTSCE